MRVPIRLLLLAALLAQGCSSSAELTGRREARVPQAEALQPAIEGFRARTEWVHPGQAIRDVRASLGSPHLKRDRREEALASYFGGSCLWFYFVPDLATVSFVVGVKDGHVTGSGFVHAAYPPAVGVLSVGGYWLAADSGQKVRWSWWHWNP